MRISSIYLLLHASVIFLCANGDQKVEPKICESIEITTTKGLKALRNCKVIVGHVRLVNLQLNATTAVEASIVEEITDYLLVYRVHGLNTLQRIFPKLKLIRGYDLLFNKYSLVVLQNRELENLGLISLLRIQKGNVRIESNPMLCFVDTVNWVYILGNNTRQDISFRNKPSHQCPLCNETLGDIDDSNEENLHKPCWSLDSYQLKTVFGSLNCTRDCGIYGCNSNGVCCSPKCLTGCSDQNCELCATFNHTNGCTDICPFSFLQFNKRECISQRSCLGRSMIPYSGACLDSCPPHYEKADNTCVNPCTGDYVIRDSKDMEALVDCQFIHGSLEIELTDIKAKIVRELENALRKIKEITKYLIVKNSPQLMSLQFLHNLHTIKGEELIDGKYALYVVNNYYLEQIWNQNQKVLILKGRIYFHLNARLCYDKILKLSNSVISIQKLEASDVSPNSNGERVICGENVRILNATVENMNSTAVRIAVNPMSADDMSLLIGYAHFYKEAPLQNVSWYDGRHGCGHDDWMMDISPNIYVRHVIRNLKPFTQYAYFVKTLTMTEYHMQLDAYSHIQYFRTLPSTPGPVAKVYFHTLSATEIIIHWWPPLNPNGVIAYYLVNYTVTTNNNITDAITNFLPDHGKPKDFCKCLLKEPFLSGPLPDDENYYSKEQITYDEALANFVYVPRTSDSSIESASIGIQNDTNDTTPAADESTPSKSDVDTPNSKLAGVVKEATELTRDEKAAQTAKEHNAREGDNDKRANETTASDVDGLANNNKTKLTKDEEAALRFQKMRLEQEKKALDLQNTNLTDFQIVEPMPICASGNRSNSCRIIKRYEGVHVPGHIHQYVISKLVPELTYNISVRACLKSDECGAATTVVAKTISKLLEDFINSAQDLSNDIGE